MGTDAVPLLTLMHIIPKKKRCQVLAKASSWTAFSEFDWKNRLTQCLYTLHATNDAMPCTTNFYIYDAWRPGY
jgi:hypothetical protein